MDIKLDVDGDLDISTGDLQLISGVDFIVQSLKIRLQFFQGEWFLDTRLGMPYFQEILVKSTTSKAIAAIYEEAILESPGVLEVHDLLVEFDGATREARISFNAVVEGSDIPLDFSTEFIIGG